MHACIIDSIVSCCVSNPIGRKRRTSRNEPKSSPRTPLFWVSFKPILLGTLEWMNRRAESTSRETTTCPFLLWIETLCLCLPSTPSHKKLFWKVAHLWQAKPWSDRNPPCTGLLMHVLQQSAPTLLLPCLALSMTSKSSISLLGENRQLVTDEPAEFEK